MDEDEKPKIDAEIAELTEDEAQNEQERLKRKWASIEALVGSDKRIGLIAEDIVKHFEARNSALGGKGMIVCMSRRVCVALYDAITKLRPAWHSEDDETGAIKVVMTGVASDPLRWQAHIGKRAKARRELIAKRAKKETDEGKKRAHRRYADAVVALSRAYALAGASDEARAVRDEVGFFQAIRGALIKSAPDDGKRSPTEREFAIQQIVSRAVVSTEIVDIMKAAGLQCTDISILSDEFLAEVRDTPKKNLAIEALKKLINGDVHSQAKRNVTQSKAFTERLEAAIARYHANALTTAEVLEELIRLAKDIRVARARGEESGLGVEERAFYDALAENESAQKVMGEPALRVIAHELVLVIKNNVSVDWMRRDSARANIRRHVKRLLRKYGYPPDLQDAAVQNVLQQAEALSAEWA